MSSLFIVINSSNKGSYIAASDKVDAYEVAIAVGHVKDNTKRYPKVEGPFEEFKNDLDLQAILNANRRGRLSDQGHWSFIKEIKMSYKVVRKYRDYNHPDNNKVIAEGLTLEEAKEHCKDPESREAGVWFDAFEEE